MHQIILGILTILALAFIIGLVAVWAQGFSRRRSLFPAVNIGEGTHTGEMGLPRFSDAAITVRHLLYAAGAAADSVAVCAADDIPIGTIDDEIATADIAAQKLSVNMLGLSNRTLLMVASEEIAVGEEVFVAAGGKIQDLPGTSGTFHSVGYALTAGSGDGALVEVQHHSPRKLVLT